MRCRMTRRMKKSCMVSVLTFLRPAPLSGVTQWEIGVSVACKALSSHCQASWWLHCSRLTRNIFIIDRVWTQIVDVTAFKNRLFLTSNDNVTSFVFWHSTIFYFTFQATQLFRSSVQDHAMKVYRNKSVVDLFLSPSQFFNWYLFMK